jgi:hypothetical protein
MYLCTGSSKLSIAVVYTWNTTGRLSLNSCSLDIISLHLQIVNAQLQAKGHPTSGIGVIQANPDQVRTPNLSLL